MLLPINIKRTRQCPRCGLDYSINKSACPHCSGLTEQEVEALKQQYEAEGPGERNLGMLFIYIAVLIVVGLLILGRVR